MAAMDQSFKDMLKAEGIHDDLIESMRGQGIGSLKKLANFSSSVLIRFSELCKPRIRAKRLSFSLPINTLT